MNAYLEYLHSTTQQPVTLLPKPAKVAPDCPVKFSRFLGTRQVWKPDGTFTLREMWSSDKFHLEGVYVRISDNLGSYVVIPEHVRCELDSVLIADAVSALAELAAA